MKRLRLARPHEVGVGTARPPNATFRLARPPGVGLQEVRTEHLRPARPREGDKRYPTKVQEHTSAYSRPVPSCPVKGPAS